MLDLFSAKREELAGEGAAALSSGIGDFLYLVAMSVSVQGILEHISAL